MMTRISRASRSALGLLILPLLFSGCLWYFYPSDPIAELLVYESFDGDHLDGSWNVGASGTSGTDYRFTAGRLEVYGPRHYMRTRDTFPTDITILLEWSVTNGDVTTQLYPAANAVEPDFSITFDDLDITVELRLYRPAAGPSTVDSIQILDLYGRDLADPPPTVASTGATRGRLEVQLRRSGDEYLVKVFADELGLDGSGLAAGRGESESVITIGVSGMADNPRALEELYFYREPADLGVTL